mmetsp:Transcript_47262/g.133275  ORF Transcript_47262/g.133275 Transcript_47262/m.133275 type:complete len:234 (+) Transcript_47262:970-1671(+)
MRRADEVHQHGSHVGGSLACSCCLACGPAGVHRLRAPRPLLRGVPAADAGHGAGPAHELERLRDHLGDALHELELHLPDDRVRLRLLLLVAAAALLVAVRVARRRRAGRLGGDLEQRLVELEEGLQGSRLLVHEVRQVDLDELDLAELHYNVLLEALQPLLPFRQLRLGVVSAIQARGRERVQQRVPVAVPFVAVLEQLLPHALRIHHDVVGLVVGATAGSWLVASFCRSRCS